MYRKITLPAGIGDGIWVLMHLVNSGEKFDFFIPDSKPQRGKQLYDLLPQVANSCSYKPRLTYKSIANANIQNRKRNWRDITERDFVLSANSHLEAGKRIEDFLPDLAVSYRIKYNTASEDKIRALQLLPNGPKYIGIYTSAYANARHDHYNGYGPTEWIELVNLLHKGNKDFVFVVIGAPYDGDLSGMVATEMELRGVPFVNTVGQPLPVVIEMLKRMFYFIGFPSGLSILNETLGKDGTMFYGHKIKGIINTWADPERIKNHNIKECLFCPPQQIFDWLKNTYKIFDR